MPIRPELRVFYGVEWRRYRLALIAQSENRCRHCGRKLPSPKLSGAHITHDPRSSLVRILCFSCHNRHDAAFRYAVYRRNRAQREGQAWLWPEVEWSPVPTWRIPGAALDALAGQEALF